MSLLRRPLRILAVAGKEIVEILRRPSALVSVVAGPVLILALFGLGFVGQGPLRAEIVIPTDAGLPTDTASYQAIAPERATIVGVTSDLAEGRAILRSGGADLLVIAPDDAQRQLQAGRQAVLTVEYDTISPYQSFVAHA